MEKETAGHGRSSGRADVLRLPLSDGESRLTPAVGSAAITAGEIHYTDCGNGPTLVFHHGVLMAGSVWDLVVDRLRSRDRCIVPTLPLGAHTKPVRPDADLSPAGFGRIVNDLLEKLDLHEVTLIGNDHAAVLAAMLGFVWQARLRTCAATGAGKHRARPSQSAFGVSSPATTRAASSGSSRFN